MVEAHVKKGVPKSSSSSSSISLTPSMPASTPSDIVAVLSPPPSLPPQPNLVQGRRSATRPQFDRIGSRAMARTTSGDGYLPIHMQKHAVRRAFKELVHTKYGLEDDQGADDRRV